MRILVTGGAGFIGSNLALALMPKHEVLVLDNLCFGYLENLKRDKKKFPERNIIKMDVRDPNIIKLVRGVDIVFHFAGITSLPECQNNPNEAYQVNVAGTANILEASRRMNVKRVIFSSSSAVYENEMIFPTPEIDDPHPSLSYSLSKKHGEEVCKTYQKLYGMDIVMLRFFNVYGPHMDSKRISPPVISYMIKCLKEKRRPILHSDGNQKRDMVYVDDVVKLCSLVLGNKKAKNQTFNVGSGKAYSIMDIYKKLAKLLKRETIKPIFRSAELIWENYPSLFKGMYPLHTNVLKKEVNKYTLASIKKSTKVLGWTPRIDLDTGLHKTLRVA